MMFSLKGHAWFAGYNWDTLQQQKAPFVPEIGAQLGDLVDQLKEVEPSDPRFVPLVKQLTSNFDDFPDEPLGAPKVDAGAKKVGSRRDKDNKFIGYTYKRKQKVRMPLSEEVFAAGEEGGGGGGGAGGGASSIFQAGAGAEDE
jgi:hypothetical protein